MPLVQIPHFTLKARQGYSMSAVKQHHHDMQPSKEHKLITMNLSLGNEVGKKR